MEEEKGEYDAPEKAPTEEMSESSAANLIVAFCCLSMLGLAVLLYLWGGTAFASPLKRGSDQEEKQTDTFTGYGQVIKKQPTDFPSTMRTTTSSDISTTQEEISVDNSTSAPTVTTAKASAAADNVDKFNRHIPPDALVCTFGPDIKADTAFPDDGLCDYTILEELPVTEAKDLSGPYSSEVQHFIDMAAKHRRTEYGVAFDSEDKDRMREILKDPATKSHLDSLFESRIFHYGYINTDPYLFDAQAMADVLRILKAVVNLLADKKSADRPIYTILASTWSHQYDQVSAVDAAAAFKRVFVPDIYISKAHLVENDSRFNDCIILPATFMAAGGALESNEVYFFNLVTALKHASDVNKLQQEGFGPAALYVSVGVYGRWYFDRTDSGSNVEDDTVGTPCFPRNYRDQMASAATACSNPKYGEVRDCHQLDCKFVVDREENKRLVFDSADTLRRKLCLSKRNAIGLKYGIVAARVEYSDASGGCGGGQFPLLSAVKDLMRFFREEYVSEAALQRCLS